VIADSIDDAEEAPIYYCDHGVEVPVAGGACYRCATEDARDDDYGEW